MNAQAILALVNGLTLGLVPLGQLIAKRVRARRAARKNGTPLPPVDPDKIREGLEDAGHLVDPINDAAKTPAQRPSKK